MKKILILIAIALMIKIQNGMASTLTPAVAQTHHVMKKGQVRGKPKLKLKSTLAILPPSPEEIIVDDDLVLGRNRNRIELVHKKEEELSDHVKIRLLVARMKALKKYQEVWQT
jgi:hypothetical protein